MNVRDFSVAPVVMKIFNDERQDKVLVIKLSTKIFHDLFIFALYTVNSTLSAAIPPERFVK